MDTYPVPGLAAMLILGAALLLIGIGVGWSLRDARLDRRELRELRARAITSAPTATVYEVVTDDLRHVIDERLVRDDKIRPILVRTRREELTR